MSDINIKEILKKAMVVIEYRDSDVDTEDGTFATTDTDAIIGLEMSLAEAFNDNGDDATFPECWANIEKYCDKLAQLQSRNDELEAEQIFYNTTRKSLDDEIAKNKELEARVKSLLGALDKIAEPISYLLEEAEKNGCKIDGHAAIQIAKNSETYRKWAKDALYEHNQSQ